MALLSSMKEIICQPEKKMFFKPFCSAYVILGSFCELHYFQGWNRKLYSLDPATSSTGHLLVQVFLVLVSLNKGLISIDNKVTYAFKSFCPRKLTHQIRNKSTWCLISAWNVCRMDKNKIKNWNILAFKSACTVFNSEHYIKVLFF